jgi:LPXTG-motif cell wall-anchored protein
MFGIITRPRILYWLAAMAAVLVGGTIIGLIWADTSDVAGSIAVITNIIGVVGIVLLLIALAVMTRRRRQKLPLRPRAERLAPWRAPEL